MRPRRTRRWRSLWAAPLLAPAALLWAVACGPPPPTEPPESSGEPRRGGTAVVATPKDITGVHPLFDGGETFNKGVLDVLFLQLFEEQPDFADGPPTFAPELAASWEWSEDGRLLSIELRPDVVWSDGAPLTADDVVWTWRLQTDDRIAWVHAGLKRAILEMEAIAAGRLRVRFADSSKSRLAELNQGHILPRHRWRELPVSDWRGNGGWFRDNLVVSGPFRLAEWRPAQEIVLERNPSYFRAGYPLLDRVVLRVVPDTSNQLGQLLAGGVDFIPAVPAAAAQRIEESPAARLESFPGRRYTYLHWNLRRPALARVESRQALTLAIDRQRIIDTLWYGHATIASSAIVSSVWAHLAEPGPWPHDPRRSAQLLESLGWRDQDGDGLRERGGRPFRLELITNSDNRLRTDALVMIQEDLRRVGVDVQVRQLEFAAMVARLEQGHFDGVLSAFDMDTTLDLAYAFHSESIVNGYNFGGYVNPDVDRLIEAARDAQEPAEQGRLLADIQRILRREQPFTFLWEPRQLLGVSRRLRGVRPNPLGPLFRLEEWWLEAL